MHFVSGILVSGMIFECPPAGIVRMRLVLFVFFAAATCFGFTPDLTDPENADGKTLAAVAATHGIAQDEEIAEIFEPQMRGT